MQKGVLPERSIIGIAYLAIFQLYLGAPSILDNTGEIFWCCYQMNKYIVYPKVHEHVRSHHETYEIERDLIDWQEYNNSYGRECSD